MKPINYEQAISRLANYCSRGEKCIFDIKKKMTQWELSESDQKQALIYLQKENFLNEKRFCKAFVNDKSKYNQWGANKIKQALRQKNISETLIREFLSSIDSEENKERLQSLLIKKRKLIKGENEYEIKQKLLRFALGRGYDLEEVQRELRVVNGKLRVESEK